jgi:hypothetical protein
MVEDIELKIEINKISVLFPSNYRNDVWGQKFGKIQLVFEDIQEKTVEIDLDISNCTWIDPLPLLSLIICVAKYRQSHINLLLPEINSNKLQSNKVLAFLQTEGFLQQFIEHGVHVFYKNSDLELTESDFKVYEHYISELNYSNCSIIKAKVIDLNFLNKDNNIINWTKDIIDKSQYDIRNKIDTSNSDDVINRLHLLLAETIHNVFEHAYDKNEKQKHLGLYVRFRNGLGNTRLTFSNRISLKKRFDEEHEFSPGLEKWFIDNIFNFIEVFVIDNGKGITKNYFPENKIPRYGFRQAWKKALIEGQRGLNSKNKQTQFGGLYSINKILGNNYICARDHNEWIGHSLPLLNENPDGKPIYDSIQIKGFSLIFRLTWEIPSDISTDWKLLTIKPEENNLESNINENIFFEELNCAEDIFNRFYKKKMEDVFKEKPYFIIDKRFPEADSINNEIYKFETKASLYFCIYLPQRGLYKNTIFDFVQSSFESIISTSKTLIIADILIFEAHLFQLAIEGATFSIAFRNNFENIILVTQRFSVLILEKVSSGKFLMKHKFNGKSTLEYFKNKPLAFSPHISLKHLIALLKTHDTLLFWLIVRNRNKVNRFYVNNKVRWYSDENEIEMIGYLNFAQTLTDDLIKKLYENSLTRTLCLKENEESSYRNIDILTDRLASRMNSKYSILKKTENINELLIGSVSVTGLSQTNAKKINDKNSIVIHFFQHNGIEQDGIKAHLFLWPKKWLSKNFEETFIDYRRVGRSHVIAPYGWKYYPIPRFRLFDKIKKEYINDFSNYVKANNDKSDDFEFISAYECTPEQTYNEIQIAGKNLVEIGHYHYENKHDLLKIDFPLLVNNSFNEGGKLAQFLMSEFLMALGTNSESIISSPSDFLISQQKEKTKLSQEYLKKSMLRFINAVQNRIDKSNSEQCAVIVYPYHYATEHIIELIKSYIDKEFHKNIFALIPVNKERSGSSFLISPLTFEAIRESIAKFKNERKKKPVALLFDEATIDGKTRKELKHLLFHLGAEEVRTICIVDRRRLPFSTTDPLKHQSYWRLDVPRLGNKDSCLLCKSLEKADNFLNNIVYSNDINRIATWKNIWVSTFPYSKSKEHGILPKQLIQPISKKFSLYINKNTGEVLFHDTIQLRSSIGLAIYTAELHSMTSRDDIALSLSNQPELDRLAIIELISFNLLLYGNEFSNTVTEKMIRLLVTKINESRELCNETAFAALTLLIQPPQIMDSIFSEQGINALDVSIKNYDLELALSYLSQNQNLIFSKSKKLINHLKPNLRNIKLIYKQFHSEIYNDFGKIHSTPLQKIINFTENTPYDKSMFQRAINSCDKIIYLLYYLPFWNSSIINDLSINDTKSEIEKTKKSIANFINQKKTANILALYCEDEIFDLKKIVQNTLNEIKLLHSCFFINMGENKDGEMLLLNEFKKLIKKSEYREHIEISMNFNNYKYIEINKWINWDLPILNKLAYIIDNIKHANGTKMKDPYNANSDEKSMWISIEYVDKGLRISFFNKCNQSIQEAIKTAYSRIKPEKHHIIELGGKIDYFEKSFLQIGSCLQTVIELPFI